MSRIDFPRGREAPCDEIHAALAIALGRNATLVATVYERDGNALNSVSNTLNINVPSTQYPQFMKQGINYWAQSDLPAQAAWLRAGIFDPASGRVGSLEVPISVRRRPT